MFPRYPILSAVATLSLLAALFSVATTSSANRHDDDGDADSHHDGSGNSSIQLGPRPFFLVNDMEPSALKTRLKHCDNGPFRKSDFSIGHRGAGLQFPEHTKESYQAAVRMGAGIVECDVTFTKDKEAGLPPFAVRPAHDHQHPGHAMGWKMQQTFYPRSV